jgi:hypothetical protein
MLKVLYSISSIFGILGAQSSMSIRNSTSNEDFVATIATPRPFTLQSVDRAKLLEIRTQKKTRNVELDCLNEWYTIRRKCSSSKTKSCYQNKKRVLADATNQATDNTGT